MTFLDRHTISALEIGEFPHAGNLHRGVFGGGIHDVERAVTADVFVGDDKAKREHGEDDADGEQGSRSGGIARAEESFPSELLCG